MTLGPRGRNVIIQKSFGSPTVTKDGVTVAKEVELEDAYENMGAQLVKQVAQRTNEAAGDGTTTATVLAEAIFEEGLKNVTAGANPVALKRGIDAAVKASIEAARRRSRTPVKGHQEIAQVGAIASNNDTEIGEMIAQAMERVGKDGVITVEDGRGIETEVEWVEGMQFDKGFLSRPTSSPTRRKMECVLEDAQILVHEKKITSIKDMIPLLEQVAQSGRPLLILAEDVEGEALATLVINRLRGSFPCVAVKAPGFGERRTAMLQDIANPHRARRPSWSRRASPSKAPRSRTSARPRRSSSPRTPPPSSKVPARRVRSRRASTRSRPSSRTSSRTTTPRSSRSVSPSSPAVSRRSTSARPPSRR